MFTYIKQVLSKKIAQSAGAVEYTDWFQQSSKTPLPATNVPGMSLNILMVRFQ